MDYSGFDGRSGKRSSLALSGCGGLQDQSYCPSFKGFVSKKIKGWVLTIYPPTGLCRKTLDEIKDLINQLIAEDYLEVTGGQYPVVKLRPKALAVLKGPTQVWGKREKIEPALAEKDPLFEELRRLRKTIAEQEKVPPYIIFNDATLREMARKKPTTKEELLTVKGVGGKKLEKYGAVFLAVIRGEEPES